MASSNCVPVDRIAMRTRFRSLSAIFAMALLSASLGSMADALPTSLDTQFGSGTGIVVTSFTSATDVGRGNLGVALAVQPDGKLLLASDCRTGGLASFCAIRYTTTGALDTTFSGDGKVITAISADDDFARAIALQPDGKIILAGHCGTAGNYAFCAARYLPGGALDTSFGSGGKLVMRMLTTGTANAIAIQPDGKIVLGGICSAGIYSPHAFFCAVRFLPTGALDPDFGFLSKIYDDSQLGIAYFDNDVGYQFAMTLQSDGKILLGAACTDPTDAYFPTPSYCVFRHGANGVLDPGFGVAGKALISGIFGTARSLAAQLDGKIILSGRCTPVGQATIYGFCTVRINNGFLDARFGSNGKVLAKGSPGSPSSWGARAMALQQDGKIVLAGFCYDSQIAYFKFCSVRYNTDGKPDNSFGSLGAAITPINVRDEGATAVALQSDGKIVLAGICDNASNRNDFCALRYEGGPFGYKNCSLDVDGDGLVLPTTDSLITARVARGMTGDAVLNGITLPVGATRRNWNQIRNYLVTQCGMSLVQ